MVNATVIRIACKLGAAVLLLPIIAVHLFYWVAPGLESFLDAGSIGVIFMAFSIAPTATASATLWLIAVWVGRRYGKERLTDADNAFLRTEGTTALTLLYVILPSIVCAFYIHDWRTLAEKTVFFTSGAYGGVTYGVHWMVFANMIPLISIGIWAIVMLRRVDCNSSEAQ